MSAPGSDGGDGAVAKETVSVTIDGKTFEAKPGELLIKVAQDNGTFIPRFCWHERMKPVGMCRMCLVEIDGVRGLPPACTTPVTDGMVCHTQSDAVKKVQDGVLEFLLVNHPLDCPVCDRGGECPLQDQTLAFGPGESRFVEEKRHWEKPIPLSDLVLLDRERCIQCARCTRFAEEIAGDPLITFVDRGGHTEVLTFPDEPFASYFSGNTVQICPVGALTASQYRFKARPWDLSTAETSCTTCAVNCRGAVQSSSNRVVRLLAVDSEPVNHGWLCDKGRYAIDWVHADDRIREPQLRRDGALAPVSWPEALDAAAAEIRRAIDLHGPGSVAVLGGARGTNEDAYAWARLAKGVIGTDHCDAQLGDGLPAEAVLGLPRAEIGDLDDAAAIVLLGPDLKEELPVLHLRVRRAAVERGVPVLDLAPVPGGLAPHASVLRPRPGEQDHAAARVARAFAGEATGDAELDRVAGHVRAHGGTVVVVLGRPSVAESPAPTLRAAAALATLPNVSFLSALRRGNVHGALEAGLAPGLLPGRVSLDAARDWFTARWGAVPAERGLDAAGILRAAADGRIHVLVLLGADPLADFPDARLAQRALDGAGFTIVVDAFLPAGVTRADVFLPVAVWAETGGTTTNLEGRVQRLGRKLATEGTAMDDWRIATELAYRLGADFDLATVDEVTDELAAVAPAFAGVTAALTRRARDGVVLPLRDHRGEIVVRAGALSILAEDGSGTSWDPIKVGGVAPAGATDLGIDDEPPADPGIVEEAHADEAPADPGIVDEVHAAEAPVPPPLLTWDRTVDGAPTPARDSYAVRLVSSRLLYDGGRAVVATKALAPLRRAGLPLRLHEQDLARLGVASGGEVRATSSTGTERFTVVADPDVPPGVAVLAFTADGAGAARVIDAGAPVTDLRLESIR